jgi:group I intron endonuclease
MYIYKTTNLLNGKIYVGFHNGKRKNYFGSGTLLTKEIKEHGKENFINEILEYCDEKEYNIKEKYWIKKLDATNPDIGYNISLGGSGVDPKTSREKALGRKFNISKNHADFSGKNNPMYGKTHTEESMNKTRQKIKEWMEMGGYTEEQIEKMRVHSSGRNNPNYNPTPVLQYDLENNLIKEWKDLYSLKIEGFNSKLISRVCRGQRKTAFGYKWKFKIRWKTRIQHLRY